MEQKEKELTDAAIHQAYLNFVVNTSLPKTDIEQAVEAGFWAGVRYERQKMSDGGD